MSRPAVLNLFRLKDHFTNFVSVSEPPLKLFHRRTVADLISLIIIGVNPGGYGLRPHFLGSWSWEVRRGWQEGRGRVFENTIAYVAQRVCGKVIFSRKRDKFQICQECRC